MSKVEYTVVIGATIADFKAMVQKKLDDGWDISGNLVISISGGFVQAMTRVIGRTEIVPGGENETD